MSPSDVLLRIADVYSDNDPKICGADRELSHALRKLRNDHNLASYSASDSMTWHFIPPIAPYFGGLREAGVESMKLHLRKLLSNVTPTVEEFKRLLLQVVKLHILSQFVELRKKLAYLFLMLIVQLNHAK